MIYFGNTAQEILRKNLDEDAKIMVKGYFKENNNWVAFDNNSGDCFVEEFSKEEEAISWVKNFFDMSEFNDFEILKIFRGLYYIKREGLLKVSFNRDNITTKLFKVPFVTKTEKYNLWY